MKKNLQPTKSSIAQQACDRPTQWFVYLLRGCDNSLYCGVTTDITRRVFEHNYCNKKGAKYTRTRRPLSLVYEQLCNNKVEAYKKEYQLKKLSKQQKERLILLKNLSIKPQ